MECHYSCPFFCYFGRNDHCGNLSSELLLVIFLANGAPCPLFSVPLSTTFFLPHIGCQAVLTMNQSLGWLFDCRWAEEVTGMHSFRSLSIGPGAFNNSLTYHFFSRGIGRSLCVVTDSVLTSTPPLSLTNDHNCPKILLSCVSVFVMPFKVYLNETNGRKFVLSNIQFVPFLSQNNCECDDASNLKTILM